MKTILISIFFLLTSHIAFGQSATDYFHGSAQSYIASDIQGAIAKVQQGLAKYPNDPKLNQLLQKLEEEQEKQQQQQQQNQENQEEQEDQQEQNQEQQNEQEQEEQEQEQKEGENNEQNEPQEQDGQPQEPKEMSKEDAEKILQALAQKEKELLKEFKKQKPQGSATHDKDW